MLGNRGRGTRWRRQILDRKWKYAVLRMHNKNMQYIPYLWPNCRNYRILNEIGIKEHEGDVRF